MRTADVSVLAVGFFDGVHLGHQAILRGADAALTFANHPATVLAPGRAPPLVMDVEERVAAIKACGVKEVAVLDFTPELAETSPDDFLHKVSARLPFGSVRCGPDWRFGRGGEGDADWLRARGVAVEVVPYAEYCGERISSSRIRACLGRGEVEAVNAMTGRTLRVAASRFRGKGMGAGLGRPTVNLESSSPALRLLPRGVYAVEVSGRLGIANYGVAPTMGDRAWAEPVIEVHFPQGNPPTPANAETVGFLGFIRPERRFESLAALREQIDADCAELMARFMASAKAAKSRHAKKGT